MIVEDDKAENNKSELEVLVKVIKVVEKWLGEGHTIQLKKVVEKELGKGHTIQLNEIKDELIHHLQNHYVKAGGLREGNLIEGGLNTLIFELIKAEAEYYKEQQMRYMEIKRPVYGRMFGNYPDVFGSWQSNLSELNLRIVKEQYEQFLTEICEAAGHPEWVALILRIK